MYKIKKKLIIKLEIDENLVIHLIHEIMQYSNVCKKKKRRKKN